MSDPWEDGSTMLAYNDFLRRLCDDRTALNSASDSPAMVLEQSRAEMDLGWLCSFDSSKKQRRRRGWELEIPDHTSSSLLPGVCCQDLLVQFL